MTWCNDSEDHEEGTQIITSTFTTPPAPKETSENRIISCPSCGHTLEFQDHQSGNGIHDLPGLPAGVKFDPNDGEILEHLEAKAVCDARKLHPLIDEFIPTLEGENGICYTHPEKLPGVSKDGQIRHFFHRPSKAYTTGTRKRRKVHTDEEGSETRWHKTGKTRPVLVNGAVKGFKKILVLYTNYGRKRKPEKTSWVMHQYHLGSNEEEKEGELVVSKVFYQTQPRQCGGSSLTIKDPYDNQIAVSDNPRGMHNMNMIHEREDCTAIIPSKNGSSAGVLEYYSTSPTNYINYEHVVGHNHSNVTESSAQLIPNLVVQGDASSFFSFGNACKRSKTTF